MLVVISLNRLNGLFYTAEDKIRYRHHMYLLKLTGPSDAYYYSVRYCLGNNMNLQRDIFPYDVK